MFEDNNGVSYANQSAPDSPPARNLPLIATKLGLILLGLSFFSPDIFYYPFRLFTPGPHGLYGTWTGIVQTSQSSASFAVVNLKFRPPLSDPEVKFLWRPSRFLDAAMDVYYPDGTHDHCTERLGTINDQGQMELLVDNAAHPVQGINEAQVTPGRIQFTRGICPARDDSTTFTGPLTPGAPSSVADLLAQIPARTAAVLKVKAAAESSLAGEWVGPIAVWDPDYRTQPSPNAVLRLTITPAAAPGTFTAQGEYRQADGATEILKFPDVTLTDGSLVANGKFISPDDQDFPSDGGLGGPLNGDTLDIKGGQLFMLRLAGTLHHGTDADYNHAITALHRLKPGHSPERPD